MSGGMDYREDDDEEEGGGVGNPKQVKKRKTKVQLKFEQDQEDLRQLLKTSGGRNFLWRVLEKCGVYQTSFANDPYETSFLEGQRQVGLWVIEEILASDPNSYIMLQTERLGKLAEEKDK